MRRSGGLLVLLLLAGSASANAPSSFAVQGVLRNNTGLLQSMTINGAVRFWDAATGGNAVSPSYPFNGVGVSNGVFTVNVSDPTIATAIPGHSTVFLEVTVTGIGVFPRQQVGSELFAIEAATADALNCSGCISSTNISPSGLPGSVINSAVAQATTAAGLQSGAQVVPMSATPPTPGQVLEFNGTNWIPTTLSATTGGGNFVDLTTDQTINGKKTFVNLVTLTPPAGTVGLYSTSDSVGVDAIATGTGNAVQGLSENGVGVYANTYGNATTGIAVYAATANGTGVLTGSDTATALRAKTTSGVAGKFEGLVTITGVSGSAGGAALTVTSPSQATPPTNMTSFTGATSTGSADGSVGIYSQGGDSVTGEGGSGVQGRGGNNGGAAQGGPGVVGYGGNQTASANGGVGVGGWGGSSTSGPGGVGVMGVGGNGPGGVGAAARFAGVVVMTPNVSNPDYIDFGTSGVAPPSATSTGWKVKLYNGVQQYGLGIDGYTQWYVANTKHRWYSNTGSTFTPEMELGLDNNPNGILYVRTSVSPGGVPDLAETIPAAPDVTAADVVCADPAREEHVVRCRRHDRAIVGVISDGSSSFLINSHAAGVGAKLTGQPLVLAGRVPVKVSLENGPIAIGDFLGPSSTPGVAMRMTEPGAGVGIALAPFEGRSDRTGTVLCFVKVGETNLAAELARLRAQNAGLREETGAMRKRLEQLERSVALLLDGRAKGQARRHRDWPRRR